MSKTKSCPCGEPLWRTQARRCGKCVVKETACPDCPAGLGAWCQQRRGKGYGKRTRLHTDRIRAAGSPVPALTRVAVQVQQALRKGNGSEARALMVHMGELLPRLQTKGASVTAMEQALRFLGELRQKQMVTTVYRLRFGELPPEGSDVA
jgi:hypothetical protein